MQYLSRRIWFRFANEQNLLKNFGIVNAKIVRNLT